MREIINDSMAINKIIRGDVPKYYPRVREGFIFCIDSININYGIVLNGKWSFLCILITQVNPRLINYTITVTKLLIIVEAFKEFCTIVLGHRLTVYIDHKKLIFESFTTKIVLC